MASDNIFHQLTPEQLLEICQLASFDPIIFSRGSSKSLSAGSAEERLDWVDNNRHKIELELCRLGSWSFGETKDYKEIVRDVAAKLGVPSRTTDSIDTVERALIVKVWNDAVAKLTPAQLEELKTRSQAIAEKYGKAIGAEVTGFAALSVAQLSGFGVYVLGSSLLGAINGALGLGLGFGAFTGLSSLISTVIGPIGWTALGLFTIIKLGAPNYKRILSAIIFIASQRASRPTESKGTSASDVNSTRPPVRAKTSDVNQSHQVQKLIKWFEENDRDRSTIRRTRHQTVAQVDYSRPHESIQFTPAPQPQVTESQPASDEQPKSRSVDIPREPATKILTPTVSIIEEFKRDVSGATSEVAKSKVRRKVVQDRKISKQDRIIFSLKPENKRLCELARDTRKMHFLDLSEEEQATIRLWSKELESQSMEAAVSPNGQQKEHATVEAVEEEPVRDNTSIGAGRVRQKQKELQATFSNLRFTKECCRRLLNFEEGQQLYIPIINQFRLLNSGDKTDKHHVPGTRPKIFQRDCGNSGRIYYRRDDGCLLIELIGDKGSQERDYRYLKNQTAVAPLKPA